MRFAAALSDHVVLQRAPARPVIWGFGNPGDEVNITQFKPGVKHIPLGSIASETVTVDPKGMWKALMQAIPETLEPWLSLRIFFRESSKILISLCVVLLALIGRSQQQVQVQKSP